MSFSNFYVGGKPQESAIISRSRSVYLAPDEIIGNIPEKRLRMVLPGIVPYSEFSFTSNPHPNIGSAGDIWIKTTPKSCALFAKLAKGWTEWRGLDDDSTVILEHPLVPGRFLWIWCGWFNWVPRQFMAKSTVPYPLPNEIVTQMLAKALADADINLKVNSSQPSHVGGLNIQPFTR